MTEPDPETAAVAALIEHDATCTECAGTLPESQCEERGRLFAARRRALTGRAGTSGQMAADGTAR